MRRAVSPLPDTYSSMFPDMPTHWTGSGPIDDLSISGLVPDTAGELEMLEVGDRLQEGEPRLERIQVWPE